MRGSTAQGCRLQYTVLHKRLTNMFRNFLRFKYAAIKRYGDKTWTAHVGIIEINPSYTVNCGKCERGNFGNEDDIPYIVELSNGTKFLCFMNDYCLNGGNLLSEEGENANCVVDDSVLERAKQNVRQLNSVY